MLEAISWKEYWMLMAGAVGLYYGWWAVKYRASLGWGWRKKAADAGGDGRLARLYAQPPVERTNVVKSGTEGGETAGAAEGEVVFPVPAVIVPEAEVFPALVARDLLAEVAIFVARAGREKMAGPEVAAGLGELMRQPPNCRLRGTDRQAWVTDKIIGILKDLGSIGLDAEEVRGLWDG